MPKKNRDIIVGHPVYLNKNFIRNEGQIENLIWQKIMKMYQDINRLKNKSLYFIHPGVKFTQKPVLISV